MTTTDPTRRAAPSSEATGTVASLLSLLTDPRGSADLREMAVALRDLAGTLERIAGWRDTACPGAAYTTRWTPPRGG
ncbi:hypothetical protein [Roseomonas alba]|uniref:hypothetical protein n=1 Tax=Roseomonas alba TaxID=2846776 RepID=UPI001CA5C0A8|nr:hypothetical protein [Neoroseomonas alba]